MAEAATTKGQRSAEELKAAALRVFARKGYLSAKIGDITAEAGKSAGAFYRYFTDKDDLLRAVADDFATALRARVVEYSGASHTLDGIADIRNHVQAYWDICRTHHAELTGLYEASLVSEEFADHWRRLHDRHVRIWTAHVAEARQQPAPGREDELTALAIVAMLERFCQLTAATASPADGAASVQAITRLVARGLFPADPP
ncbi:TetR/AcrR family transcriptional regulator [Streptomyces olivoreticuli]